MTSQLEVERLTSHNAIEQLEQELCDKRQLQEDLNELQVSVCKIGQLCVSEVLYSDTQGIFKVLLQLVLILFHFLSFNSLD